MMAAVEAHWVTTFGYTKGAKDCDFFETPFKEAKEVLRTLHTLMEENKANPVIEKWLIEPFENIQPDMFGECQSNSQV